MSTTATRPSGHSENYRNPRNATVKRVWKKQQRWAEEMREWGWPIPVMRLSDLKDPGPKS